MENKIKQMYRAKELAQFLGIGLSTVWLYAKQGKITPKKISTGVTVFDINEVLQKLELKNSDN
ncbi:MULTISPECIES: helix-turn-helix transcriptional regulator [Aliarcobacter]|uniref:helix-turn-helix transcriptional regulator n=1 Tax=Aliarcobacter TaxID=2321111 RepID=UPI0021B204F5|nr:MULTISPECIES: DNA-binding protein [Aliarcobacter]MCT7486796.1 DNA-binding protein [Aliarcobacter cryaerophilus]MCT7491194.1 DNA-binding protein [Aliarcobacter cryaerophilus]MCT7583150.1 DNA-binding protein [Aliarcobacter butzleri]